MYELHVRLLALIFQAECNSLVQLSLIKWFQWYNFTFSSAVSAPHSKPSTETMKIWRYENACYDCVPAAASTRGEPMRDGWEPAKPPHTGPAKPPRPFFFQRINYCFCVWCCTDTTLPAGLLERIVVSKLEEVWLSSVATAGKLKDTLYLKVTFLGQKQTFRYGA